MRSLFSFGASKEMRLAVTGTGHRPEVLRLKTLANNARIAVAASAVAMPFAIYALLTGNSFPFVLDAIAFAAGMIALSLHHNRRYDESAAVQVYAMLAVGLILSLADHRLGDAGLAVALMAPVLAALLGRPWLRQQSWGMLAGTAAIAGLATLFGAPAIPVDPAVLMLTGLVAFFTSVVIALHTASRIGGAYQVYDKDQVNAYRHLIEHVQDGVLRFSSDGEVLLASQSSEKLFGCRRYEITGSSLGDRLHVLDRPAYLTAFADANQGGKSRVIEVRMRRDDPHAASALPHYLWVEVSLSPVLSTDTDSLRHEVVALFRDVTGRKDAEAAMSEARNVAERASEAKSRFLATIGHELRTPLNAVVGFSEMMTTGIGGELSPTHREYAGLIHQSGKHLLEVVRMLLDMSKIEAGKFELQQEPFAVGEIIEPCFNMVEAMARTRHITLRADIADHLPMLTADERACRQVLLNLLSNAIKFSHEGGVVSVSVKRQGQSINLSVVDRGVGMAPESLERVGEPFFQAQDGLARRYEGTGLGLSIVKGLVDLHGGTLRAMSELGAGTTITVLLPINGPAIKSGDTGVVTPLRKEPPAASIPTWQDEKRKAQ